MQPTQVTVRGTLRLGGVIELDEKPNLPPGPVQVTIQVLPQEGPPKEDVITVLERIWKEREARGDPVRAGEEIDAEINALRDEWEERMRELDRIHEQAGQARETPEC